MDAKAAGKGKVTCTVSTPDGAELDVDVVENHDGTFDIYYTAPEPGKYVITIRFGGEHIPNSPFHVLVSARPTPGQATGEGGRALLAAARSPRTCAPSEGCCTRSGPLPCPRSLPTREVSAAPPRAPLAPVSSLYRNLPCSSLTLSPTVPVQLPQVALQDDGAL